MPVAGSSLSRTLALAALLLVATPALAHVPQFGADNHSPETAIRVDEPTKSWAIYDTVGPDQAAYYRFSLEAGERLYVSLFSPRADGRPSVVVMRQDGAAGPPDPAPPPQVTVPAGYTAEVVAGTPAASADFEPFTPAAYYVTAEVDRTPTAPGTYLLAVYDGSGEGGPVGTALGRTESFSPVEYLTVPLDALSIHAWEGDPLLLVAGPGAALFLVGLAPLRRALSGRDRPVTRWLLGAAALALVGTAANLAAQLAVALATAGLTPVALVTVALVAVPVAVAAWLLRVATAPALALTPRRRLGLLLAGVGGLATWAGLLVAPLVPILVALAPPDRLP